ncbi:MAG: nucleotidyl transferase AbiEii/AbiGii toxin family protein [Pleurocapsa sp.]
MANPNIENLEQVAAILAKVPEKFVFTGGATIVLYVNSAIATELRPTKDVDCVVEIFTRAEYYQLSNKLRAIGLSECTEQNAPICRWQYEEKIIDIMPCGDRVLGFSNCWYLEGIKESITYTLPSGKNISIFSPLYILASKVEAFRGRGKNFYHSKDIEDITVLLNGCAELSEAFNDSSGEIRSYLQQWFKANLEDLKDAAYNFSPTSNPRCDSLVIKLIENIAQS